MFKKTYALALGVTLLVPFAFNAQAVVKATGYPAGSPTVCTKSSGKVTCKYIMKVSLNISCGGSGGEGTHYYAQAEALGLRTGDGVQLNDWAQDVVNSEAYVASSCGRAALLKPAQPIAFIISFLIESDIARAIEAEKFIYADLGTEHKARKGFDPRAIPTREEARNAFGGTNGLGSGHFLGNVLMDLKLLQ